MLNCQVCGKPNPEHIFHCTEHYKCEDCGATTGLCTRTKELTCGPCHAKRAAKKVAAFDEDTDYTDEITCPWCGNEQGDSWEHEDSCEHECDYCGKKYEHNREIEVHYSTSKIGS